MIPRTIREFRDDGGATATAGSVPASPATALGLASVAQAPPGGPARRWDMTRTLRAAAAVAGVAVIGVYLGIAVTRLGYPGPLEILEGNSLVEVHRILAGQQLYAAPSASYVPDGYTPLYFAVSAAAASVLGQSFLPLRLVSLVASLACFVILGRLVQRETRSRTAGLAAAGLLAATYFATGTWFDVGRVDSLFLALSVAGLYAARRASSTRGAIAAGLLLGAAFLTKQSALAEGVAVLAALAAGSGRRLAGPAVAAYVAVIGGSTLVLGLASHGWYVYYVFQQMSQHALSGGSATQFWTTELLPTFGVAICAVVLGARRTPLVLVAGCAALAVESFAARAQTGSNVNDLLPAYLSVALLAGLAMAGQPSLLPSRTGGRRTMVTRLHRGAGGQWVPVAVSALVVVQLGVLAGGFRLSQAFPPKADRIADQRLVAGVRALGGTVAIPADPGIAVAAGLPPTEDMVAAADVLRASDREPQAIFITSLAQAVATQKFSGIITEYQQDLRGFPPDLRLYYYRCPRAPLDGVMSVPFSANAEALLVSVWLPIGHGPSCAAVARAFGS
ncbi:MAG: glycosyltransferase family 39 protein [Trebonia sp.]